MTTVQRPAEPANRQVRSVSPAGEVSTSLRLLLGVLLSTAALVHLALTPEHYRETPLFGAFFAVAGAVQLGLAVRLLLRREASWRVLHLLRLTSLVLLGTYIATRVVTPPLAPHDGAEPVDVLGVLAGGVELASIVAVLALPARAVRTSSTSKVVWAAVVAIAYGAFFAVASGAVVYNRDGWPPDVAVPSVSVRDTEYLSLLTPRVNLVPTEHLAVSAPLLTLLTLALSAVLLGANTALARTSPSGCAGTGAPRSPRCRPSSLRRCAAARRCWRSSARARWRCSRSTRRSFSRSWRWCWPRTGRRCCVPYGSRTRRQTGMTEPAMPRGRGPRASWKERARPSLLPSHRRSSHD